MDLSLLPSGDFKPALEFKHFPNRVAAFVFRNWNLVSVNRLATVLRTGEAEIIKVATMMKLPPPVDPGCLWIQKGYITLIRQNWHLLPYEQILELLDWTPEQLKHCLKEDDFLWHKLGNIKPDAALLRYQEFTEEMQQRCVEIGNTVTKNWIDGFKPFEFAASKTLPAESNSSGLRMIYPYDMVYGEPLLDDELAGFPEKMFRDYAAAGINALWMPTLIYQLMEWDRAPEMSGAWETRRRNLKKLTERAKSFGIEIILYFNEPRSITAQYAERFTDLKGLESEGHTTLCTSQPETLKYLKSAMHELFADCNDLGGIFLITRSENPTNCASHNRKNECPRCAKRQISEIVAETVNAMAEGVLDAKPTARVLAYTWAWATEYFDDIITRLNPGVTVLSVSEWGVKTDCEGISGSVVDYSISHPGPSADAVAGWRTAQERDLNCAAKIQINNSWKMSTVPYLPVYDLIEEHLNNLRQAGVNDFMLSWTLGGFPSPVVAMLTHTKEEIAETLYGASAKNTILAAWKNFSNAFRNFPFNSTATIYLSPVNCGCANLLYLEPTGYLATMVGIPYDDLDGWRGIYPPEVFERAFSRIVNGWNDGLELLAEASSQIAPEYRNNLDELTRIADAIYSIFRSTMNQIAFIRKRGDANSEQLIPILEDEMALAKRLMAAQTTDARIGFESSNHYSYTPNLLVEKILNCQAILKSLKK